VPTPLLQDYYDEFALQIKDVVPNFASSGQMRDQFAFKIAPRFGVNDQVIAVRLDRDAVWPAS
jgi:hypothetical protein